MHDTMLKIQFHILNSAKDKKINEKKMKAIKLQKSYKTRVSETKNKWH